MVYVSPLKALSNDIHKNLEIPLTGIQEKLDAQGLPSLHISVAVRTSDTPQSERQKMIKRPPPYLGHNTRITLPSLNKRQWSKHVAGHTHIDYRRNSRDARWQKRIPSCPIHRMIRSHHRYAPPTHWLISHTKTDSDRCKISSGKSKH